VETVTFYVGQKVVAITNGILHYDYGERSLESLHKGAVYTIRSLEHPRHSRDGVVGLRFVGITNPIDPCGLEMAYQGDEFRPAVEPSIEIFTAMLSKTPKENRRLAERPTVRVA
jgi:hypothetical protein